MKKIALLLIITAVLVSCLPLGSFALEDPEVLYATNCAVYNIENSRFCYEMYTEDQIAPAGTAKIMTAILALEYYEGHYDAEITVGDGWLKDVTGLTAQFKRGEVLVAEKVISALIIGNGNDAAYILAYSVAGDVDSFVGMMNQKAEELGMTNTHYTNPAGTDQEGMYTSVGDVVKLACHAYTIAKYIEISDSPSVALETTNKNNGRNLYNRNYFISNYYNTRYLTRSVMGLNAGYSSKAGWCVTAIGRSNSGLTYVVVVMGARDPESVYDENGNKKEQEKFFVSGYEDALMLLDWAYKGFGYFTLVDTSTTVCEVPVKLSGNVDHVVLLSEEKLVSFLPMDTDIDSVVTKEYTLKHKTLKAPISKGQVVGEMTVYIDGEAAGTVNLIARNNVERTGGLLILDIILSIVTHPVTIAIGVLILLIIVAYVLWMSVHISRKRQVVRYRKRR